jgi:hypothetical protein
MNSPPLPAIATGLEPAPPDDPVLGSAPQAKVNKVAVISARILVFMKGGSTWFER